MLDAQPNTVLLPGQGSQDPATRDAVASARPDLLEAVIAVLRGDPSERIDESTRHARSAISCALVAGRARVADHRISTKENRNGNHHADTPTSSPRSSTPWPISAPIASCPSHDATLEAVDVDSLDLVELTQVVEEAYDISLENADFKQIRTVGDIVDLVAARVQA